MVRAVDFYYEIQNAGKLDDLERYLDDLYPEGMTMTALNDLLWFEEDTVREWLDMLSEEQLQEVKEQDAVKWWEDNKYKHSKFTEEDEEAFCYTHQCENCPYIGGGEFGGCTEWLHADKSRISFKDMVDLYEECGE